MCSKVVPSQPVNLNNIVYIVLLATLVVFGTVGGIKPNITILKKNNILI